MTEDELLADACPRINALGGAFMFAPSTVARGETFGLDIVHFYGIGRAGLLGDADPAVVYSAFGYFYPELIRTMWASAREKVEPREAGLAYLECAAEFGRLRFAGLDLDAFCAAAGAVNDAADPVALVLYAAVAAEPLVDDAAGRAGQLLYVLRELRGGAHLAALRCAGLNDVVAHYINTPDQMTLFGWPEDTSVTVTERDREAMIEAERMTDAIVRPAYAVLDDAGRRALVDGLIAIEAAVAEETP